MNCPGHVQIFKHGLKSYRDLPLRLAEFGAVHRYEPSGALHGLMRVRGFTQDDAHIFCTEEQLAAECLKINDLILSTYADFGFDEIVVKLSTRPEKRVGTDEMWDHAEDVMTRVLEADRGAVRRAHQDRRSTRARARSTGRSSSTCCAMPSAATGNAAPRRSTSTCRSGSARSTSTRTARRRRPVMVHRAICGSMERFTGILIEHFAGHFPLWLAPVQAVVATITSDGDDYAMEVVRAAEAAGLRVEADLRNEKINYKVREHSLAKVPVLLVVGRKEAAERTVSIRRLGSPTRRP